MSIFDELSSATGDNRSNDELALRCLQNPYLLHTLAEGLRTGSLSAQVDCAQVMIKVSQRRADLVAPFVSDFLDTLSHARKGLVKAGLDGILALVGRAPNAIYAERDQLFSLARKGGPIGKKAFAILCALCEHSANYRGKLQAPIVKLLTQIDPAQLPRWIKVSTPAFAGSVDGIKRLERELSSQLATMANIDRSKSEAALQRLKRARKKR